ncbi:MAG: hypothetical protein IBX45_09280 [Campylobacterales bacterium]|nr:hypothetical protein [Campylobacterales bacterium]
MHVTQSDYQTSSSYHFKRTESASVRVDTGSASQASQAFQAPTLKSLEFSETFGMDEEYANLDPRYKMLLLLMEQMFGKGALRGAKGVSFHTTSSASTPFAGAQSSSSQSSSPIVHYQTSLEEHQAQVVEIHANIELGSGENLEVSLNLKWEQHFMEKDAFSIQNGQIFRDPLVLSLVGSQPLAHTTFAFNLQGNEGKLVHLGANSGYLVLDKNGNGVVDSGSELFGPTSGEGFKELARLDEDGNGWIDSNDSLFSQLKFWHISESANQLLSLEEVGIGALSLHVTPMDYVHKSSADAPLAAFKNVSLGLSNDYQSAALFEVDIAT